MLFSRLPDTLFLPLAGPNRAVYQAALLALGELYFDEHLAELFPRKELVRSTLSHALERLESLSWQDEGEEPILDEQDRQDLVGRIYRRLLATGWLEEEPDGYRIQVLMNPAVSQVLRTLVELKDFEKKSYGGAVLAVLNNLEPAIREPGEFGQGLAEAAAKAHEFNKHLGLMIHGLREILKAMTEDQSPDAVLAQFFERFVAGILVADYKTLKTQNNPFRFRRRILELLGTLRADTDKQQAIAGHYRDNFGLDAYEALLRVQRQIGYLVEVFEHLDERLDRVDEFRYRLEKRVAEAVRYMDKTRAGSTTRLARLLERLGGQVPDAEGDPAYPLTSLLHRPLPLGPHGLPYPQVRRTPPPPRVLQNREVSAEALRRREAIKAYETRRRIQPALVEAYVERALAGREALNAADFPILGIEDFLAFNTLRRLPRLSGAYARLARRFAVESGDGLVEIQNLLMCKDFSVKRVTRVEGECSAI
ncbi:MAG: hypothetical protein HYV16_05630 [Gammaproteobacteria bacterium]|nr:hypothetical protein [Gammaproteobacteria bacterium]